MKAKEKECSFCGKMAVLWRSNPKTCASCAKKHASKQAIERHRGVFEHKGLVQTEDGKEAKPFKVYRTKEIKKVSTRMQKLNTAYSAQRKVFLKNHKNCAVKLFAVSEYACTGIATTVHHMAGRIGEKMLDERYWLACCLNCHRFIEEHPVWAKEKGFSLSRLTISDANYAKMLINGAMEAIRIAEDPSNYNESENDELPF